VNCGSAAGLGSIVLLYLNTLLSPSNCLAAGVRIIVLLAERFASDSESAEVKELCLQGIFFATGHLSTFTDIRPICQTDLLSHSYRLASSVSGDLVPYSMRFLWVLANEVLQRKSRKEHPNPDIQSILQPLYDQCPKWPRKAGLPTNVGDIGFADLWIDNLREMSRSNPQNILDSRVLREMIEFYMKWENYHAAPCTTNHSSSSNETRTWLEILNELQDYCYQAIESGPMEGEPEQNHNSNLHSEEPSNPTE
jgi:hypothetical protein